MEKKTEDYVRKYHMIGEGSHVIAAVSGGADSVCLLRLLVSLRQKLGFELQAIHVHHGLRGSEADGDARYVKELSALWGVPCLVVYRNAAAYGKEHTVSVEEAGRRLRYEAFSELAGRYEDSCIAVAHHKGDQAETILHHLFRGSGLRGLGGMAPVRGKVIRPLLWAERGEILLYLKEQGISYREDSTNQSLDYTRNRLRQQVIPMICREINPAAPEHIVAAGERLRQADEYFRREAEKIWEAGRREGEEGGVGILAKSLTELPEILRGYVIMEMIRELTGGFQDISSGHVAGILELAEKGTGRRLSLPYGLQARKEYDAVWVAREQAREEDEVSLASYFTMQRVPAEVFREKYQKIPEKKYTKWFDYDRIKDTLSLRTRRTGDYITLKGGKKKTVKAFMIDEKIPREERERIPLLAEGRHVLWIVGYRISECYKITDETKQILQVSMDGGEGHEG